MADTNDDIKRREVQISFLAGQGTDAMKQFAEAAAASKDLFKQIETMDFKSMFATFTQALAVVDNLKRFNDQQQTQAAAMRSNALPSLPMPPPGLGPSDIIGTQTALGNFSWRNAQGRFIKDPYAPPPQEQQPSITTETATMAQQTLFDTEFAKTPSDQWGLGNQLNIFGNTTQGYAEDAQSAGAENSNPSNPPQPATPPRLVNFINLMSKRLTGFNKSSMGAGPLGLFGAAAAGMASPGTEVASVGMGDDGTEETPPQGPPTTIFGALRGLSQGAGQTALEGALVGGALSAGYRTMGAIQNALASPFHTAGAMASMFNPYSMQTQGAALGYQRGGPFLGLPFASPFSPATSQGLQQALTTGQLALGAGINLGQAQQIVGATAGYGFSGQFGNNVATQLLGPLFQQFGANPQEILQNFGGGLRTGVITIQQLRGELQNLGQAAQGASMSLTDTANAVASANQAVSSIGGTPQVGIGFGTNFQANTGLPANVGGQLITNPFVQGIIAMDTGVMPQLQGTLGPTALQGGITQSIQMLNTLFGHAFPTRTQDIRDPQGRLLYTQTETGQQQADALAANYLGLDIGQYQRLRKYGSPQQWATSIEGLASHYTGQVSPGGIQPSRTAIERELQNSLRAAGAVHDPYQRGNISTQGAQVTGYNQQQQTVSFTTPTGQTGTVPITQFGPDMNQIMNLVRGSTSQGRGTFNEIEQEIRKSHLWTAQGTQNEINHLNQIYTQKGPQKAAAAVTTSIQNQLKNAYQGLGQGGQTISIVMKGQAAKQFAAYPNSIIINANSGTGPTTNYATATPQGLYPLGLSGYSGYDTTQDSPNYGG